MFVDLLRRTGLEAYKQSVQRATFVFVEKLKDRLAEPAEEAFRTRTIAAPWLLMLVNKAIYLMAREGAKLTKPGV